MVELDGHHYALIVDVVEDVVEALSDPSPIRAAMGDGWERVSQGMVETEEGPLLLVDIAALIAGPAPKPARLKLLRYPYRLETASTQTESNI